jgi:hypothetical protein
MFFATTGVALAINAGKNIRNTCIKLSKNIMRNEKCNNGDKNIDQYEDALCETYCPYIPTIYPVEYETSEE